jgi:hypothetical protein
MGSLVPGWGGPPAELHDEPTSSLMRALSLDSESERQLTSSAPVVQRKTFAKMSSTSPRGADLHGRPSPECTRRAGASPSRSSPASYNDDASRRWDESLAHGRGSISIHAYQEECARYRGAHVRVPPCASRRRDVDLMRELRRLAGHRHHRGHRLGYTGAIPMPPIHRSISPSAPPALSPPQTLTLDAAAAARSVISTPAPMGAGPSPYRTLSETRVEHLSDAARRRYHQLLYGSPMAEDVQRTERSQSIWCVNVSTPVGLASCSVEAG